MNGARERWLAKGWTSTSVLAAGALAAVTLVAFVWWQRRVEEPLLDVRLFENPRFTAASSTIMVLGGALGADVADAAREAFVHAMSRASIVAALVAALGAFIAWRYLPARGDDQHSEATASAATEGVPATAGP